MTLDVRALLREWEGRNYELHDAHVNPQFAKVLKTIGFDRCYTRGTGQYLWDVEGTQYLDMTAGYGVFNVGRNNAEVARAIRDVMEHDYPNLVQLEAPLLSGLLAAELKKRVPDGLDIVYFTNSGTEGVETAIKLAHGATGRPGILYCRKAFHGLTTGSLAINGDETFRKGFSPLLSDCREVPFNDLAALEEALSAGDVAAFVVEPIQGKGVNIPDPGYLAGAAALCRRHGALFVVDEVQTGLGRTGRFLAIEHEAGVEPDILIVSKALSGGYMPVGAVLMRRWIYDKVFSSMERAVVHSSTFGQNGLAMAAGLATLTVMDEMDLCGRSARLGDMIGNGLTAMQPRFEFLKDIRWRGLMVGIEFGEPRSLGLRTGWHAVHKMDRSLFPQAVTMPLLEDHHILTQVAGHHIDVIKLLPPLVIDESDVSWFLSAFETVMDRLHRFPGPAWDVIMRIGRATVTSRPRAASAGAERSIAESGDDGARTERPRITPGGSTVGAAAVMAAPPADPPPPTSWVHDLARRAVRPIVDSRVTPNHLTTARLVTGLAAAAAFAVGAPPWIYLGGALFVLSAFLDRADGELARLRRQTSRFGHLYDLVSDGVVTVLTFVAIGFGLGRTLESEWPLILGVLGGIAVGALFCMVAVIEARSKDGVGLGGKGRIDPDDVLFVIGPLAWIDELWPLLVATAVGAPLFGLWMLVRFWKVLTRPAA